jgi:hypothetical protein
VCSTPAAGTAVEQCGPLSIEERHRLTGARGLCEACRTVRSRAQTLILRDPRTRRTIQLGTSCAKVYTGAERPELAIRRAQTLARARAQLIAAAHPSVPTDADDYVDLELFLAHTVAVVREHGYATASSEKPSWRGALARIDAQLQPSTADLARVAEIKHWAREIVIGQQDTYTARMTACLAHGRLSTRELPLAASAVRAYNHHLYWEIRRRKRPAKRAPDREAAGPR